MPMTYAWLLLSRLQLLHPRFELLNAAVHRQQHLDYSLAPRVIDRLRLRTLHTRLFAAPKWVPAD